MGSLGEAWAWSRSRDIWGRGYVNLTKCARNGCGQCTLNKSVCLPEGDVQYTIHVQCTIDATHIQATQ